MVLADIQDSLDSELESFGVDRQELERKLALLTPVQQFAMAEMIEAFWEQYGPEERE